MPNKRIFNIYCDASATPGIYNKGEKGSAGIGYVIKDCSKGGVLYSHSCSCKYGRNINKLELNALTAAVRSSMQHIPAGSSVNVFSDNQCAIRLFPTEKEVLYKTVCNHFNEVVFLCINRNDNKEAHKLALTANRNARCG